MNASYCLPQLKVKRWLSAELERSFSCEFFSALRAPRVFAMANVFVCD